MNIQDLTTEQYKEYKQIALLNNQGKFKEFSIKLDAFIIKHNLRG